MKKLTPKQERFCDEYLIDLNATQAAIRAGYSKRTAQEQSSRLLSKAIVSERIEVLKLERSEKTKIDAAWVLLEAEDLYKACREVDDLTTAKSTLDLIGKHVSVQAFKEVKDLNFNLGDMTDEQLVAARDAIISD